MSGNAVKRGEALNLLGQQWKVDPCTSVKVSGAPLLPSGEEGAFRLVR
jgi:hypothetical protein